MEGWRGGGGLRRVAKVCRGECVLICSKFNNDTILYFIILRFFELKWHCVY